MKSKKIKSFFVHCSLLGIYKSWHTNWKLISTNNKKIKNKKNKAMKKSMLILAAVVILLIGVNAQQKISEEKGKVVIQEKASEELYTSIAEDFENWYKDTTENEMMEDEENLNLYNDIYENFELTKKMEAEEMEEKEYNELYRSLKEDLEIYQILSISEIKF